MLKEEVTVIEFSASEFWSGMIDDDESRYLRRGYFKSNGNGKGGGQGFFSRTGAYWSCYRWNMVRYHLGDGRDD